jgi:pyruvate dehydrogenase E2 component (dihydrolipoamide acetyltransferase)
VSFLEFEFPDTGEGVTEGKFLEWKVEEGDQVEEDQVLGEAETDKAVVEIPSPTNGTVKELKASPGDEVEVGDVIMIIDQNSESEERSSENEKEEKEGTGDKKEDSKSEKNEQSQSESSGDVKALPKVRKLAEEKGVNLSNLDVEGRVTEEDVIDAAESSEKSEDRESANESEEPEGVNARPSVKKLAREKDIEISMIEGSGRGGEVTREDVVEAAEGSREKSESVDESDSDSQDEVDRIEDHGDKDVERVEMSGVRKSTAEKMEESKFSAPHVTHIEKVDITELVEIRESVKSKVDAHLTYLPFIMKACVAGLKDHPLLNAELDQEKDEIIKKYHYDFNIAVDTDRGLLVPRIDDVDDKSMVELAESIGDKAERAQSGELRPGDMEPGTFSITNLGVIGGEAFTPIIYPPQSAILGVGKIQETAEVIDGEVKPRTTVKLSLSYDHRVVDGAEAARFMNKIKEDLENPRELIVDI